MTPALLLLAALLPLAARAQLPGVPHGGGLCASELDCSLGGTCGSNGTAQVCTCDAWWTGPACDLLNLQPAESLTGQGLQAPDYHSWGGHPLQADDGSYHLFASFMCNHATLGSWTSKSSVAHATSDRPEGPFTLAPGLDAQLVVPPWSHGAYIVRDPPTQQYLLWHLGDGTINPATWRPCYNSSESGTAAGSAAAVAAALDGAASALQHTSAPPPTGQRQAFVQTAPSLLGPWTAWNNNTGVFVTFPAVSWTRSIDNPAPYIFENGTTLLFFRSETCPQGWGNLAPACIGVARADTWQGPYTSLFSQPITHPEGEDPAVFMDPRGNLHMLTNVNTYHARCRSGVACGGHAWSKDGLTWSNQTIGAFGPVIRFTNGSYFHGAYAERPQVLQAKDGTPIAFYMGYGRASYMDSVNWAQKFCAAGMDPSADCGPQLPPPPPPPVQAYPKQNGRCLVANSSVYPCAGGWAESCPVLLGDCADATASWAWAPAAGAAGGSTLTNLAPAPPYAGNSALNIDCNDCSAGTLVKVTQRLDYADAVAFSAAGGGTLQAVECPGMCLSGAASAPPPRSPCKAGEWTAPQQVVLVPCSDSSAGGWTNSQ